MVKNAIPEYITIKSPASILPPRSTFADIVNHGLTLSPLRMNLRVWRSQAIANDLEDLFPVHNMIQV